MIGFSQTSRKAIIDNKIKAITKAEYKEPGNKRRETKTYYTIRGDDSLIFINGEMVHSFTTIVENGRIVQLERVSGGWFLDQLHFYKYNSDSSYSIEILAYEEKRTEYHKYNSKHEPLLTVFDNSDTSLFKYNSLGKSEGLILIKNGKKTEVNITEMNSTGDATRVEYKSDGILRGFSTYKYNEKGLQEEVRIFAIDGKADKLISKTELKYDFYYP
ncbi:hypothetical protein CAP36_17670 [Chitinophagaceae bacterium IBVUCB2]|nr:hypothetical protein CAP36_17670 [Chitinophagaceae bacterium IBVUCB2]